MYSSFNKKCHHFSNPIIGLFISLFIISSCEHEIPVENQTDTTPTASVRNLNATAGDKTVYLSWTNPSDSDFYGTRITFSPSVSGVSQPVVIEGESSENSSTVFNGLKNGIEYTFTLVALDKNQNKSKTVSIKATPKEPADTTPPKEVTELKAEISDTSVILTWKNPDDSDFSSAQITFIPDANGITQPIIIEGKSSEAASTTIHGLENNVVYTFTLKTIDKKQNQSQGVQIKATISDTTPPEEVKDITTEIGDKAVILMWTNPDNSDFSSTLITFTPEVEGIEQPVIVDGKPSETSKAKIEGLEYDTEYTFTLKTIDKKQNQSNGTQIKTTPIDTYPPEKIKDISAVAGDKAVTLSWTNPGDTDFEGIQITFTPEVSYIPQPLVIRGEANKTANTTISGLQNDTTYTFKITAFDKVGNKSETVSVKASPCDKTPPAEISNLTTSAHPESITLNWTNPSDIDFSAVEISSNPAMGSLSAPKTINGTASEQKSYTISELVNGWEYTLTIKTIDINGNKSEGTTIKATPIKSEISLLVNLPNDNENKVFTNDTAPINLSVNSSYKIKKAVWTKHNGNTSDNPEDLINDTLAEEIPITGINSNTILYAKENGIYDIAVQDEENEIVVEQIEIRTIDKTPLPEVSNLMIICEGGTNYTISWKNPQPENNCDAPLKEVQMSCIFNNDTNDINNKSISLTPSIESYTFSISEKKDENDFMNVYIHNVDEASNKSSTTNYIIFYKDHCVSTNDKNADSIPIYDGENTEIIIYGDTCDNIADKINSLNDSSSNTTVSLDLRYTPGLTQIYYKNFYDCSRLTNIQLSNEITSISDYAFYGCSSLTDINIPSSVTSIGMNTFSDCSSLKTINIPDSVTSIGGCAFSNCSSLKTINIPDSVTSIGGCAFSNCSSLTSISIPSSITKIEGGTFSGCSNLKDITIPSSITHIYVNAFLECSSLISIDIPSSVWYFGNDVFKDCINLTNITIQSSWIYNIHNAFSGCSNVTQMTLTGEVFDSICNGTTINKSGFKDIKENLQKIIFIHTLPEYPGTHSLWFYFDKLENVIIPEEITTIGNSTFCGCQKIKTITIPNGVTTIGSSAFSGCSSLISISIPSSITSIEANTFDSCISLTSIDIPTGVTSIGNAAFYSCTGLKTIKIPKTVTSIGSNAFKNCTSLTAVEFQAYSNWTVTIGSEIYQMPQLSGIDPTWNAKLLLAHDEGIKTIIAIN